MLKKCAVPPGCSPNTTLLAVRRFLPLSVTAVPPDKEPDAGLTPVMAGTNGADQPRLGCLNEYTLHRLRGRL